ncbi:MAG: alkaline phosphatase family protein [Ardenticatenaceae bacterium]|nr:alkaline phosphatase family protein [Ardenticatenaceae bacterium]HBY97586.1 phosphodiesterase [Chloroflexota bacterium]
MTSAASRRVLVIGLDCAEPSLVFERWRQDLPTLNRLLSHGAYGRLESSHPPITVPAWSSMLASCDPGQLGFYGFRNRADYSYEKMTIANSAAVQAPRVWDVLSQAGKRSIVVGVPQTYPVQPLNGLLVSDFLTPPDAHQWTYPPSLAEEITTLLGGEPYEFDVKGFRTNDKAWLLDSIYRMTRKRWRILHALLEREPWDFFMVVEMGTDRIHHGLWSTMDPQHLRYQPGNPFEQAIHDYYVYLDNEIGSLLDQVGDKTIVMVVSDHGAQRMDGGFCVNEWFKQQGYLALNEQPPGLVGLDRCRVNWSRTRAWGSGGYYARIFMNVAGREPQGIIPAEDYEAERDRLKAELEATTGPDGQSLGTVALKPQAIYREVNGIAPDLIVYFGGLRWRSVGTLGHGSLYTFENDTGPDDANHAQHGLIIVHDPRVPLHGQVLHGLQLECIGPTLLHWLGVDVPETMMGTPIPLPVETLAAHPAIPPTVETSEAQAAASGYTPEEEEAISDHLAALGYL